MVQPVCHATDVDFYSLNSIGYGYSEKPGRCRKENGNRRFVAVATTRKTHGGRPLRIRLEDGHPNPRRGGSPPHPVIQCRKTGRHRKADSHGGLSLRIRREGGQPARVGSGSVPIWSLGAGKRTITERRITTESRTNTEEWTDTEKRTAAKSCPCASDGNVEIPTRVGMGIRPHPI